MNKIKNTWLHQPHTSAIIRHACLAVMLLWFLPCTVAGQTKTVDSDMQNYSRLNFSFAITQPVTSSHGVTSVSTHNLYGMNVGYLFGINLTDHRLPLFLEVGPEGSYVRRTEEIDYWDDLYLINQEEISTQLLSISSPINLAYLYRLTDNLVLVPSAGLNAKLNLVANNRVKGETFDLFDQDAHRFQLGWNAGCGIYLHRYYLGLRYTADITSFLSQRQLKEKYQNIDFSIGLRF